MESVERASGKGCFTSTYKIFLARWVIKRRKCQGLSWKETAEILKDSGESVFCEVKYVVDF